MNECTNHIRRKFEYIFKISEIFKNFQNSQFVLQIFQNNPWKNCGVRAGSATELDKLDKLMSPMKTRGSPWAGNERAAGDNPIQRPRATTSVNGRLVELFSPLQCGDAVGCGGVGCGAARAAEATSSCCED